MSQPGWNERRCFDCSDDLGDKRFAVLKQTRDFPADDTLEPWEIGIVRAMCFEQVFVCADCAGWYGEDAIDVSDDASAADEPLAVQRDEAVIDSAELPASVQAASGPSDVGKSDAVESSVPNDGRFGRSSIQSGSGGVAMTIDHPSTWSVGQPSRGETT